MIGNTPLSFFLRRESVVSIARKEDGKLTAAHVPDTSMTLLRDVVDSRHARWDVLYSRYRPMMEAFLALHFPGLDADDIIQETLIALVDKLPTYRYAPNETGHFRNYLTESFAGRLFALAESSDAMTRRCEPIGRSRPNLL